MSHQQRAVRSSLRFIHLRYKNDDNDDLNHHYAITIGYNREPLLDGTPGFQIVMARCRWPDHFCKRIGRAICEGRISSKDYYHIARPPSVTSDYEFITEFVLNKVDHAGSHDSD